MLRKIEKEFLHLPKSTKVEYSKNMDIPTLRSWIEIIENQISALNDKPSHNQEEIFFDAMDMGKEYRTYLLKKWNESLGILNATVYEKRNDQLIHSQAEKIKTLKLENWKLKKIIKENKCINCAGFFNVKTHGVLNDKVDIPPSYPGLIPSKNFS